MYEQDDHRAGRRYLKLVCAACLIGIPAVSSAYVGPGAGLTMLSALWAVVLAVVFVVGGLLLWPIRALLRRFKGEPHKVSEAEEIPETSKSVEQDSSSS